MKEDGRRGDIPTPSPPTLKRQQQSLQRQASPCQLPSGADFPVREIPRSQQAQQHRCYLHQQIQLILVARAVRLCHDLAGAFGEGIRWMCWWC
jgi:hypothetical protein